MMETSKEILEAATGFLGKILSSGSLNIQTARQFMASDEANNPDPIVEGLLHKEEFLLCSATAKTGKTFLAIELAKCVVTGTPFLGKYPTTKGRVLYFETELKPFYLKQRLSKMLDQSAEENDELLICKKSIKIDTSDGEHDLIKAIMEYKPDLVILDPFYRLHTKNEDKAQEITPVLGFLKEIAQIYKTAFFVLHHEGKRGESSGNQTSHRPRGSSAFADVPDVIISMTRDSAGKSCRLAIENRNYQGSKLHIRLKEDHSGWEVLEDSSDEDVETDLGHLFATVLTQPLSASELKQKIADTTGESLRNAERKISKAIQLNIIDKISDSRFSKYKLKLPPIDISYEMTDVGNNESSEVLRDF